MPALHLNRHKAVLKTRHNETWLWAENGQVCIEAQIGAQGDKPVYVTTSISEGFSRVKAIWDMIGNSSSEYVHEGGGRYADEVRRFKSFCLAAFEQIKEAIRQKQEMKIVGARKVKGNDRVRIEPITNLDDFEIY